MVLRLNHQSLPNRILSAMAAILPGDGLRPVSSRLDSRDVGPRRQVGERDGRAGRVSTADRRPRRQAGEEFYSTGKESLISRPASERAPMSLLTGASISILTYAPLTLFQVSSPGRASADQNRRVPRPWAGRLMEGVFADCPVPTAAGHARNSESGVSGVRLSSQENLSI